MDITNKTKKSLTVSLPKGKKLFLGPGKTGQVTEKALKHPPVVKLLEAGDLETSEGAATRTGGSSGNTGKPNPSGYSGTGAMRQSGDR
tara:strand:- start:2180 stop:2443 length:264 start_codon:yes stop_codon:yes gene_type:complete